MLSESPAEPTSKLKYSLVLEDQMASGWDYVGTIFGLGRLFFALGWFLSASCTSVARAGCFFRALARSGLDFGRPGAGFGAFKTTLVDDFSR